jgi:NAD(P)-dependent dehydrogenase (short-subunit alcohol dehydrogenase family)
LDEAIASAAGDAAGLAGVLLLLPEITEAPNLPNHALQVVLKSEWQLPPQLWVITRGAQSADPQGGELLSIDHAATWGTCRVIAEEHPDLWGGLVDLDPKAIGAGDAPLVVLHILARDGEDQVAIRGSRRFVLRLVAKAIDESTDTFRPRRDAAYLITGGLGDVGLHLARALAMGGARRLILLGRSGLPPRDAWATIESSTAIGQRIAAVRALEAEGVSIHIAAVDASDESALRTFLDHYRAEAWPLICGVVHAVGSIDDCLAHSMSRAQFDKILDPKLRGAQHLDRLLPDLDFFVLMSSTASFLPQTGHANYAAANAGLDALAHDRRSRGSPAISIGWGVWEDTGLMKGNSGALRLAELTRQGIEAIPPAQAAGLFMALCASGESSLAVLPVDWVTFKQARIARNYPIFADNIAVAAARPNDQVTTSTSQGGDNLDQIVRKAVGTVLKISLSRLDPRKPLGMMGLTSLMAIELRNMLENALKRPLSATLAWNHPTIDALVEFLDAGRPKPTETPFRNDDSADAATGAEWVDLSNLSDAEALAALRNVSGAR